MPVPQQRLFTLGVVVLVAAIVATVIAVIVNLPAQFGDVGTDAGSEFASRGTVISPPIAPLIALAASLVLLRRNDVWATAACVVIALLGILFVIGSVGEAAADATPDVSKGVLVGAGVVGAAIGSALVVLAIRALVARSKRRTT